MQIDGTSEMCGNHEAFLNNRIKMIDEVLGINFCGETIQDKENFFKQHEQQLNDATHNIMASMYDVLVGKVKVFRMNECDWVAAESIEQAIEWYKSETGLDDEDLDDPYEETDLETFKVTFEKMDKDNPLYKKFGHLQDQYLNQEQGVTFKVPAIKILFSEWEGKPYIFCSKQY